MNRAVGDIAHVLGGVEIELAERLDELLAFADEFAVVVVEFHRDDGAIALDVGDDEIGFDDLGVVDKMIDDVFVRTLRPQIRCKQQQGRGEQDNSRVFHGFSYAFVADIRDHNFLNSTRRLTARLAGVSLATIGIFGP
jgi:hypothetical protein